MKISKPLLLSLILCASHQSHAMLGRIASQAKKNVINSTTAKAQLALLQKRFCNAQSSGDEDLSKTIERVASLWDDGTSSERIKLTLASVPSGWIGGLAGGLFGEGVGALVTFVPGILTGHEEAMLELGGGAGGIVGAIAGGAGTAYIIARSPGVTALCISTAALLIMGQC